MNSLVDTRKFAALSGAEKDVWPQSTPPCTSLRMLDTQWCAVSTMLGARSEPLHSEKPPDMSQTMSTTLTSFGSAAPPMMAWPAVATGSVEGSLPAVTAQPESDTSPANKGRPSTNERCDIEDLQQGTTGRNERPILEGASAACTADLVSSFTFAPDRRKLHSQRERGWRRQFPPWRRHPSATSTRPRETANARGKHVVAWRCDRRRRPCWDAASWSIPSSSWRSLCSRARLSRSHPSPPPPPR